MNSWPYLAVIVLFGAFLLLSTRNRRRRVAAEMVRVERIGVGTEVMTTSGLYGTVVARHDDGTVLLAIAPGVEVKWASAALRDADSLAAGYRRGLDAEGGDDAGEASSASATNPAGELPVEGAHTESEGADLRKTGDDGGSG